MNEEEISQPEETKSFSNTQLQSNDLPQWEDIEFEPLAKTAPWDPFWQGVIFFSIIGLAVSGIGIFTPVPFSISLYALGAVILLFILTQWHNFASHGKKVRGVAVREQDIGFKKGLFWRSRTLLPFNRVQHIEIHRNPFERKLGLSSLRIFTAGGSGVDLLIPGLENERAEKIKQFILEESKKEVVDQ